MASRLKEEATANAATAAVRPNTNTTTRVDLFFEKWFRFFLPHNCHPPRPLRPDGWTDGHRCCTTEQLKCLLCIKYVIVYCLASIMCLHIFP